MNKSHLGLFTFLVVFGWALAVPEVGRERVSSHRTSIDSTGIPLRIASYGIEKTVIAQQQEIGLHLDLFALEGQLAAVKDLTTLFQTNLSQDAENCKAAKENLRAFHQAGVTIRQNNFILARDSPQMIRSLAQLEGQQVKDIAQINNLTCKLDNDGPILDSLQQSLQKRISAREMLQ